jgi:hypothetical protein
MSSSIPETVRRRRDLEQIETAKHARRFSGTETLLMGLRLSALALRIAGDRHDG